MEDTATQTIPAPPLVQPSKKSKKTLYIFLAFLPFLLFGYYFFFRLGMFVQKYQSDKEIIDLHDKMNQMNTIIKFCSVQQKSNPDQAAQPTPTSTISR